MRIIALVAIMILIVTCRKEIDPPSPKDARRIDGNWEAMIPPNPEWQYHFQDGRLNQKIEDLGIIIASQDYVYATTQDTVFISGSGGQRTWVCYFECNEIVRVFDASAQLSPVLWLRRK